MASKYPRLQPVPNTQSLHELGKSLQEHLLGGKNSSGGYGLNAASGMMSTVMAGGAGGQSIRPEAKDLMQHRIFLNGSQERLVQLPVIQRGGAGRNGGLRQAMTTDPARLNLERADE